MLGNTETVMVTFKNCTQENWKQLMGRKFFKSENFTLKGGVWHLDGEYWY